MLNLELILLVSLSFHLVTAQGKWSPKKNLQLSPTSAAHLGHTKVLVWSANAATFHVSGSKGELYQILNSDGTWFRGKGVESVQLSSMFCTGTALFPDGSVFVNGGGDISAPSSSIFDVTRNQFSAASNMNIARGYNADVMLTNDLIFTIGGSFNRPYGGRNGEVYNRATNTWTLFNNLKGDIIGARTAGLKSIDPQGIFRSDNHAWLAAWYNKKNGRHYVFHLGPIPKLYLMDVTAAPGTMNQFWTRPTPYSMNSANVMFSPGQYFSAGGATAYSLAGLAANPNAIIINLLPYVAGTSKTPQYRIIPMLYPRTFANAVVMPGGKIFVVGGQTRTFIFQDKYGVLEPEIYDPATGKFTLGAKMAIARNYHSWALLMYDGTIMVGGGGLCVAANKNGVISCPKDDDDHIHQDVEIYTPSYLNGKRPTLSLTKASTNIFLLTRRLNVKTSCMRGCTFEMFKRSSVTHSTNNDQIRVPLTSFYVKKGTHYSLSIDPQYQDWITSGHYMLFAIERGVPSISIDVFVDARAR